MAAQELQTDILKFHKMELMSHFDKTVMIIGNYYHQGSTNRHLDQESKYWGIKDN